MTTNLIPFGSKNVPTRARNVQLNDDLIVGGGGFPKLSIKGKVFALVRSGERKVIKRPDDPDTAASSLEVVVLRTQKGLSKSFYKGAFKEGEEAKKPDCYSRDGEKPDSSIESPVARTCAACPNNQFGSAREGKGKACQDIKRLAVAAPDRMDEPMLLQVPPGSLKSLTLFGKDLKGHNAQYNEVVTKISFDMEAATPQLVFRPLGFLPEDAMKEAASKFNDDVVQQIVGLVSGDEDFEHNATSASKVKEVIAPPVDEDDDEDDVDPLPKGVVEEAEKAVSEAKTKKPKKKEEEPALEIVDEGLDELLGEFDD